MKKKMNNKGFSLVELIIVIAIMVILVAVLAPQYLRYVEKSRVATDTQTTVEFINALQVIAADPDAKLVKGTDYSVKSVASDATNPGDTIKASSALVTILTSDLGLMESSAFGTDGVSTSKYTSTAYKSKAIELKLTYDSTSKLWKVSFTGVDNSGAVLP